MTTISNLKAAINNQSELNLVSTQLWAMNFERLIKQKFSIEFATKKATELSLSQLKQLSNA